MKPNTPMIDKAKQLEGENLLLVQFLKWLNGQGWLGADLRDMDRPHPNQLTAEDVVARFQGIDLAQVAKERAAIVDWANRAVTGRCQRQGCDNPTEPGFSLCPGCIEEAIQRG